MPRQLLKRLEHIRYEEVAVSLFIINLIDDGISGPFFKRLIRKLIGIKFITLKSKEKRAWKDVPRIS
jgi:hypothetical protein